MKDWRRLKATKKVVLGRYLVADPKICGGRLTFRGTRVLVGDVLEQVATGINWEAISESWGWAVRIEAIEEAMRLTREALLTYWLPGTKAVINALDEFGEPSFYNWWQQVKTDKRMELGDYVVAIPNMGHGKLTFRGSRIFVASVLTEVANGCPWDFISENWGGRVSKEAIAEAAHLACEAFLVHWRDMEIPDAEPDQAGQPEKHVRSLNATE